MKAPIIILLLCILGVKCWSQTEPVIRMRCYVTVSEHQPLWVIAFKKQGYILKQSSAQLINPNTIENLNVLKDAASTALYGTRAAYGVIIVTIKKAESRKEYKRLKPYLERKCYFLKPI